MSHIWHVQDLETGSCWHNNPPIWSMLSFMGQGQLGKLGKLTTFAYICPIKRIDVQVVENRMVSSAHLIFYGKCWTESYFGTFYWESTSFS